MKFCDWHTAKQTVLSLLTEQGAPALLVQKLRSTDPAEFLRECIAQEISLLRRGVPEEMQGQVFSRLVSLSRGDGSAVDFVNRCVFSLPNEIASKVAAVQALMRFGSEITWFEEDRPFYNVFPIVVSLANKTKLNFPIRLVQFPNQTICFRFAASQVPGGYEAALVTAPKEQNCLLVVAQKRLPSGEPKIQISHVSCCGDTDQTVDEALESQQANFAGLPESIRSFSTAESYRRVGDEMSFIYRLAVIAAQLASGSDLITPIVLERDRGRHATAEEPERKWLEERATRVAGRGFDFGRTLQRLSEQSPHWRNPHLALFWTGANRQVPKLQLRAGCVVMPRNMSEIPTGYLGPESESERDGSGIATLARITIPKRLRFEVLRRDGYRCQLCGLQQKDGIVLHLDHKVPVSKGGPTTIENLWTLCQPCNSGKSDSDLVATQEETP